MSNYLIDYFSNIIEQSGDAADGMYFVEGGTVSIQIGQDGGETEISVLSKGQYFGELALVTHRPRAASAYASTDVKVACKWRFSIFFSAFQSSIDRF